MPYDETLAERTRALLSGTRGLTEKRMFGGLCFLLNGHMCCGIQENELVLRLDSELACELLQQSHTRPMDFTGRPLKGFVYVEPEGVRTEAQLRKWVRMSIEFARSLPPKTKRQTNGQRSRVANRPD